MKINELLNESAHDDWNDEEEIAADPDQDKIPHLVMQLKKAMDVRGNYPITFKDGRKSKIPLNIIQMFMNRYLAMKPMDREKMQELAARSIDGFKEVLATFKAEPAMNSIYT
jgi:hypothetical protein